MKINGMVVDLLALLKKMSIIDWIYMSGQVLGSSLIAANVGLNVLGYFCFLTSCIAGLYLLKGTNVSNSMIIVTLYFTLMNIIGIIRYSI